MLRASCVETHPCETGLALGFLFPSQYWTLSQNDISLTQTHTQSHHYPRPTFPVSSCVQGPCMKLSFLQFESHKAQSVCSLSSDGRVEQLTWLKGIGRLFCCVLNYGWITTWTPTAHYRKHLSSIEQNLSSQVFNLAHCDRFRYRIIRFAMRTVKHNREKWSNLTIDQAYIEDTWLTAGMTMNHPWFPSRQLLHIHISFSPHFLSSPCFQLSSNAPK